MVDKKPGKKEKLKKKKEKVEKTTSVTPVRRKNPLLHPKRH